MIPRLSYFIADFKYFLLFSLFIITLGIVILLLKRNKIILALLAISYTLLAAFFVGEIYYRYIFDATAWNVIIHNNPCVPRKGL